MRTLTPYHPRSLQIRKLVFSFISRKTASGAETLINLPAVPAARLNKLDRKSRRRIIRWGIITGNFLLLVGIGVFILSNRSASQTIRTSTASSAITTASSVPNPLDQLSSAQIALEAARMTKLAELPAVRERADSEAALISVVRSDTSVLSKPQIVETAQKSKRDIITYVTNSGDTLSSLAATFRVSTNSIRWSNSITADTFPAGKKLYIPPGDGIVYQVKRGDTIASLVSRYRAPKDLFIAVNDAEVGRLRVGERIWIPNGIQPAPVYTASSYGYFSFGYSPAYGSNGYIRGFCTWYAASKVAVPSNWGNANTWDDGARASGWTVSSTPRVGAIAQTHRMSYLGHVAIVEAVSADRKMIKYSDMNGLAGWNRVGRTADWVPASTYENYISP